jgi:hypothetical protein
MRLRRPTLLTIVDRARTRFEHQWEIRRDQGLREFAEAEADAGIP